MRTLPEEVCDLSDGIVTLRAFNEADVEDLTRACKDEELHRWTVMIPSPYEERHARWFLAQIPKWWQDGTSAHLAIADTSGTLLGAIALESLDLTARTSSVGYWVSSWARNKGIATRALGLLVGWAFNGLGVRELSLLTMVGNRASERVAEKVGFQEEGEATEIQIGDARRTVRKWVLRAPQ